MIRRLDESTVGQIAAGEVVERPISVVKELVENALDAGATRVAVTVARGGLETIDVVDDGAGIAPYEMQLAFARHATSKLREAIDLERVATLGFRGEGLASIAAVARVRMISRTPGSEIGYAVDAHDLGVGEPEPIAAPPGTRIIVRDLFANVPVRREYVRSPSAEFTRIATFLATLALAYPGVTFSLAHDGKPTFVFPGGTGMDQRLAHVFGAIPARALVALRAEDMPASDVRGARVRGFVSAPGSDRGDRRMQLLFINGRLLRSTLLAGAWSAGYATFALAHRQPFGVLFVDVAPDRVDPNVHPTKSDVRLRHPESVHDAVKGTIVATLAHDAAGRMRDALAIAPAGISAYRDPNDVVAAAPFVAQPFAWAASATASASSTDVVDLFARASELRILAQLDDTFVLATDGRALVLVDQHAAHERVAFEAIAARAKRGDAASEPLLLPYTIELDTEAALRFERSRVALADAGLDAEPFGERTYRVTATPAGYGARAFDVRGYIDDLGDEVPGLDARERVWASLACHSVVRAGEALEHAEMSALLARLVRCENPMHCPHGRPTIVRIEAPAIARMFKRT